MIFIDDMQNEMNFYGHCNEFVKFLYEKTFSIKI